MPITLQSTVGGFTSDFRRQLPRLERAMHAHGFDPSSFVIAKDRATPPTIPLIGPFFFNYTVFVDDTHFTVTEPNDMRFPEYFYNRLVAEGDDGPDATTAPQPPKGPGMFDRLLRWMTKPI